MKYTIILKIVITVHNKAFIPETVELNDIDFLVRNGYKHSLTGFLAQLCTIPSLLPLFLFYVVYFAFVHVVSVHVNHVVRVSLINKRKW